MGNSTETFQTRKVILYVSINLRKTEAKTVLKRFSISKTIVDYPH